MRAPPEQAVAASWLSWASCMEETKPYRLVGITAAVLPPCVHCAYKITVSSSGLFWNIVGLRQSYGVLSQGRLCVYIFISRLYPVLSRSEDRSRLHIQYSGVSKRMYVIESWGKLQFQELFYPIVIFRRSITTVVIFKSYFWPTMTPVSNHALWSAVHCFG